MIVKKEAYFNFESPLIVFMFSISWNSIGIFDKFILTLFFIIIKQEHCIYEDLSEMFIDKWKPFKLKNNKPLIFWQLIISYFCQLK